MFDRSLENDRIYLCFFRVVAKSTEMIVSVLILLYMKMIDLYLSPNSHVTLRKVVFMTQDRIAELSTSMSH